MKKKMCRLFSMFLAVVMCLTAVPAVPAKAANGVFESDTLTSNMATNTAGVQPYYWKGEKVELSVYAVDYLSKDAVEWTVSNESALPNIEVKEPLEDGAKAGYKKHSAVITIGEMAGTYTVTASNASYSATYDIKVEEGAYVVERTNKEDYMFIGENSTITVVADASKAKMNSATVTKNWLSVTTSRNTTKYPGSTEFVISVNAVAGTDEERTSSILLNILGDEDVTLAEYQVKKPASQITSLKVIETSSGVDLEKYPHIGGNTLYMDAGEIITLKGTIEGSTEDSIQVVAFANNGNDNATYATKSSVEESVNTEKNCVDFTFQMTGVKTNSAQQANNQLHFTVRTMSGKSVDYSMVVYDVSMLGDPEEDNTIQIIWQKENRNLAGGSLSIDLINFKSTFTTANHDPREVIEWESKNTGIGNMNPVRTSSTLTGTTTTFLPKAPAQVNFVVSVLPNLVSPRGQHSTIMLNVRDVHYPSRIIINRGSGITQEGYIAVKDTSKFSCDTKYMGIVDGKATELNATYEDYIKWKSSNTAVGTIDEKTGDFTAKAEGTTYITALTADGVEVDQNRQTVYVYAPITSINLYSMNRIGGTTKVLATGSLISHVAVGQQYLVYAKKDSAASASQKIAADFSEEHLEYAEVEEVTGYEGLFLVTFKKSGNPTLNIYPVSDPSSKYTVPFLINEKIEATTISIASSIESKNIAIGDEVVLTATQRGMLNDGLTTSNEKLEWKSSNPSIISVVPYADGSQASIKALAAGEATITARGKNVSQTITFTGVVYASKITLKSSSTDVAVGKSVKITPTVEPLNCSEAKNLKWSISDTTQAEFVNTDTDGNPIVDSDGAIEIRGLQITERNAPVQIIAATSKPGGTLKQPININVRGDIDGCYVEPIEDVDYLDYLGNAKLGSPEVEVRTEEGGNLLTKGTHYTVKYTNNNKAGTVTVTITGVSNGGYTGTKTVTFNIIPATINSTTAAIADYTSKLTYDGKEKKITPPVSITINGTKKNLSSSSDFTYVYTNNINAGTMTVTAVGKGNYTGSISKTFTIEKKDASTLSMMLDKTYFEYESGAIVPEVTVKNGSEVLTKGKDYTVMVANNISVSTSDRPAVTIIGLGNFTGTKVLNFTITARDISKLVSSDTDDLYLKTTDYVYNGKAKKPAVVAYYLRSNGSKVTLKKGRDYTITYSNNINKGIARATITGIGNYRGMATLEFGIAEKVSVSKAKIKSVKNSKAKTTVVTINKVSKAAGYEIEYSLNKKFPKGETTTKTSKKNKYTIKNLKKGKKYYVRVRAYKVNSINRTIYGSWSTAKAVSVKK